MDELQHSRTQYNTLRLHVMFFLYPHFFRFISFCICLTWLVIVFFLLFIGWEWLFLVLGLLCNQSLSSGLWTLKNYFYKPWTLWSPTSAEITAWFAHFLINGYADDSKAMRDKITWNWVVKQSLLLIFESFIVLKLANIGICMQKPRKYDNIMCQNNCSIPSSHSKQGANNPTAQMLDTALVVDPGVLNTTPLLSLCALCESKAKSRNWQIEC